MFLLIVGIMLCLFADSGLSGFLISQKEDHRCDVIMEKVAFEDRGMTTDNSPFKLHSSWLSQQCETRAGPEQANVIRKYSFFANNTFVLIRYHYADESCSIAMYAIVARGTIEISSSSIRMFGATEANARLDSVHLIPFNRQVSRRFRRRINAICARDDIVETKWRPYQAEPIYERSIYGSSDRNIDEHGINSNSFESRLRIPKNRDTLDCLEMLGIEFTELKLVRVEKRISGVELLLGETSPRSARLRQAFGTRRTPYRLQSMALLRADTLVFCPICGNVLRATQYSPPLFHQVPTLPAEIGGLWLSVKCESVDKGFWARRVFRIYSGGGRWTARWTYYTDYACSIPSCTVMATGSIGTYARRKRSQSWTSRERPGGEWCEKRQSLRRQHRQEARDRLLNSSSFLGLGSFRFKDFDGPSRESASESKHSNLYFRIFRIFQMKRAAASGSAAWSKNCLPTGYTAFSETSLIPTFKARINLDWNGDYALLLTSWKDNVWETPLRRCSDTISSTNLPAKSSAVHSRSWQKLLFLFAFSDKLYILFAFCLVSRSNNDNCFLEYPIIPFFTYWLKFHSFLSEHSVSVIRCDYD